MRRRGPSAANSLIEQDLSPLHVRQVSPPPGWQPVADVCATVRRSLDTLTQRIVDAIYAELFDYATAAAVTRDDLSVSVYRNIEMMLAGIAEHRGPRSDELMIRSRLGQRRAQQGLPIDALVAAYHVGYRELWAELVAEAQRSKGRAQTLLLEGSATVWGWVHEVTNAVTGAYRSELAQLEAGVSRVRSQFVEMLMHDPESPECRGTASDLGLDPKRSFRCLATLPPESSEGSAFRHDGGIAIQCSRGRIVVTITQGLPARAFAERLRVGEPLGIGLEREGLAGARQSAIDAESALELSVACGHPRSFEDSWLESIVLANARMLTPLTGPVTFAASEHPHLAAAVLAYFRADMSLARTAREMHVAANSVRHRLNRWKQITGWDPWTVSGLARSMLVLDLTFGSAGDAAGKAK